MKVYNEDKTIELNREDCSTLLGYFIDGSEEVFIPGVDPVTEEGHYEVIAEYENGGKDVKWVVDIPGQEAVPGRTEIQPYQIYIPYTEEELKLREYEEQLQIYKNSLAETDFYVLKYLEGWYTPEEYEPIKGVREHYREEVRRYTTKIKKILDARVPQEEPENKEM